MLQYKKAGILLLTLVIPAFIYLYLRFGSKNYYTIPKFIPEVDSSSGKLKMGLVKNEFTGKMETDTIFKKLPSFSFLNQDSSIITNKNVANKILVSNFIFTRCGLICPKMTNQMNRVQAMFEENEEVVLLSHTVDPLYDRPFILKKYALKNDAIKNKWYFLTGAKKDLYQMALKGYFIPVSDASVYNTAITNPDEAFIHSEKIVLVDKEGVIRGFYDGTSSEEVDRLMVEIKVLLDNYKNANQ